MRVWEIRLHLHSSLLTALNLPKFAFLRNAKKQQGSDEHALVDFTTLRHIEHGTIVQLTHNHSCGVRFRLHGGLDSTCHYTVQYVYVCVCVPDALAIPVPSYLKMYVYSYILPIHIYTYILYKYMHVFHI